jgi:hypothetical protein
MNELVAVVMAVVAAVIIGVIIAHFFWRHSPDSEDP